MSMEILSKMYCELDLVMPNDCKSYRMLKLETSLQQAYGTLWRFPSDNKHFHELRKKLLEQIGGQGSAGQRAAVEWSCRTFGKMTDVEVMNLDM